MAQIPLYLPDPVARELSRRARERGVDASRLLAELVRREVPDGWPDGFFDRETTSPAGGAHDAPPEGELRDDV